MKLLAISDIHGEQFWIKVVEDEDPDILVLLGDYFDSYTLSAAEQLYIFNKIIELKKRRSKKGKKTYLLIGNHDFHYFPEIGYNGTSGYQFRAKAALEDIIRQNRDHFQAAYQHNNYLFTHAGVSKTFLDNCLEVYDEKNIADFINKLFIQNPKVFKFNGFNSYGDDPCQTPIWIRPNSLIRDTKDTFLWNNFIQVVGHTSMDGIIDKLSPEINDHFIFLDGKSERRYLLLIDDTQKINFYDKTNN